MLGLVVIRSVRVLKLMCNIVRSRLRIMVPIHVRLMVTIKTKLNVTMVPFHVRPRGIPKLRGIVRVVIRVSIAVTMKTRAQCRVWRGVRRLARLLTCRLQDDLKWLPGGTGLLKKIAPTVILIIMVPNIS